MRPSRWSLLSTLPLLVMACGSDPGVTLGAAEDLGTVSQAPNIRGRDGALSTRVFGRSVWTFGDTVLEDADARGENWHHNSYASATGTGAALTLTDPPGDATGAPAYLLPPAPDEQAFNDAHAGEDCEQTPCRARFAVWPGRAVAIPGTDEALVFFELIYAEVGDFAFEGVGSSVARWRAYDAPAERVEVGRVADHSTLIWEADEGPWSHAPIVEGGFVHVFSCPSSFGAHACRIARAKLDAYDAFEDWRYYDGDKWVADPDDATDLFDGGSIIEVSYVEHLDAYLLVYSAPFSHDVMARTAPALTGPWSGATKLFEAPEEHAPYDAVHHPELEEEGGRVQYVTYSTPTEEFLGSELRLWRVELDPPE